MTEKIYTLLQLTESRLQAMIADGHSPEELNDLQTAFTGVLHDSICGGSNIAFTIVDTPDGPLVDWNAHTEEEWADVIRAHELEQLARTLFRKMFGS